MGEEKEVGSCECSDEIGTKGTSDRRVSQLRDKIRLSGDHDCQLYEFTWHARRRDAIHLPFQGKRTAAPSMKWIHCIRLSIGASESVVSSPITSSMSSKDVLASAMAEGMCISCAMSGVCGRA